MPEVMTSNQDISPTPPDTSDLNRQREVCKKCNQLILEGHAYELGDDRWHIHCFNCSKCNTSLGCNSNFLVLGNGNLICSNCSYNCKQCGRKIDDLAILTGDQAYCSNCFKCRSCKNKIEDLRYARTSKGLFCMDCHEKLMAKKKKYDAKKKHLAMLQEKRLQLEREKDQRENQILEDHKRSVNSSRNSLINAYMTSNPNIKSGENLVYQQNNPSAGSVVSGKNKLLPLPPSLSPSKSNAFQGRNTTDISLSSVSASQIFSESNTKSPLPLPPQSQRKPPPSDPNQQFINGLHHPPVLHPDNDFSIEEVQNTSESDSNDDEASKTNGTSLRNKSSNRNSKVLPFVNEYSTPPLSSEQINRHDGDKFVYLDVLHTPPENTTESPYDQLKPGVELTPKENTVNLDSKSKNFLILSPNQFHDHEFHNAKSPIIDSPGTIISGNSNQNLKPVNLSVEERPRSTCSSPYAKANRQARVVETNDEILTEGLDDDLNIGTPKQQTSRAGTLKSVTSPPPKAALPSTPSRNAEPKKKFSFDEIPKGLGLEGVDYDNYDVQRQYIKQQQEKQNHESVNHNGENSPSSILNTPKRTIGNYSPAVTNLESPQEMDEHLRQQNQQLQQYQPSRKNSIMKGLKHKRSTSGNQNILSSFFKSKDDGRSHTRHASDGSVTSSITNAYISPPITSGSMNGTKHFRSTSDSTMLIHEEESFDMKAMKNEIQQMGITKNSLDQDIKKLKAEKQKLAEQLKSIQSKISSESIKYDNLIGEINELQVQKINLTNDNKELVVQQKTMQAELAKLTKSSSNESDMGGDNSTLGKSTVRSTTSLYKTHTPSSSKENFDYISPQQQQQQQPVEDEQTHKAARLKFWRRPKIGVQQVSHDNNSNISNSSNSTLSSISYNNGSSTTFGDTSGNGNHSNNALNFPSTGSRIPNSFSSQALRILPLSNNNNNNTNLGVNNSNIGGKFTKSKSTNILDSLLSGDSNQISLFNSTIQQRADYERNSIPLIVTRCLSEVETRGLDFEGIYRISGGNSAIVSIENAFSSLSNEPDDKQLNRLEETLNGDIHAVTSALKRYLRKLPEPIIPYVLYDEFIKVSANSNNTKEARISELINVINKLPNANKQTLKLIVQHLQLVNSMKEVNKMGYKNLSVVFAPTLARDETGEREMSDMGFRNDTTELLLSESSQIF